MKTESSNSGEPANSQKTIWVFTPSRTNPEDLEFILVQRQKLIQDAVDRVRESALTNNKHHLLFVGPRGCGKTHLVTLIVNRLSKDDELSDHLLIAWLNEDETCTELLELLVKIHLALTKRYPGEYRVDMLGKAYDMKPEAALEFVSKQLLSSLGSRTLLVVAENLDAIFDGLGEAGQKQLRAFIQENPLFCIVATAQRLVEDLSNRNSPFFGFFQTEHLKPLNIKEATELLQNIAQLHEKTSVVEFLSTPRGRSRVRALHHLSGGNHRIYIVLSQFITRDSIETLLELFTKMVDELTPYYQERIRWLPPLQRKIVEYLCTCEVTVPVKEIAKKLFSTPQTISSQLQDLREKGYVEANQRGRESLYEISEPLMRICVEVKDIQQHEPLRLLVDFLRVWYEDRELKDRLDKIMPTSTSCAYLESAIKRNSAEGNLRKQIFLEDLQMSLFAKLDPKLRDEMIQELATQPEGALLAIESWVEGNTADAMRCLDEEIFQESVPDNKADLLFFRGSLHFKTENYQKAREDYTATLELSGISAERKAAALFNRAFLFGKAAETQRQIEDYTAVIKLVGISSDLGIKTLINRGLAHENASELPQAMKDYTAVIEIPGAPADQVARALLNRGNAYREAAETKQAIQDYNSLIGLSDASAEYVAAALINRGIAYGRTEEKWRQIGDYTKAIDLPDVPVEQRGNALFHRAVAYSEENEEQRVIDDCTAITKLPNVPSWQTAIALSFRGITHTKSGEIQRAIEDCTALLSLPEIPIEIHSMALYLRGVHLFNKGRKQESQSDFEAMVRLPSAPTERIIDSYLALSELHFSEGRWNEGFQTLEKSLEYGTKSQPPYHHAATDLIGAIFIAGLSPEGRGEKVRNIFASYNKHRALPVLGEAIVQHIGNLFRTGAPFPSADNLEGWALIWEQVAENAPDFRLSLRLLRTGINFVKAGGKDRGILLDLTSTERAILEQALALVEKEQSGAA